MKLGDLRIWGIGKNAVIRFPIDTGAKNPELALMAGMWILENFVEEFCDDKNDAINVIADRMRKHLLGDR